MDQRVIMKTGLSKKNSGFSMIEILVSVLVISVGFLNIISLQTVAKKSNFESLQRTSAVILARDITEKMRANPVVLGSYLVAGIGAGSLSQPSQTCIFTSKCNSIQLAAYDLWLWEQAMDGASESRDIDNVTTNTGGLANPTGCVTGPASGGAGVYTITMVWRGLNELANVSSDTCGTGSGTYGNDEEFRRLLTFNIFISP